MIISNKNPQKYLKYILGTSCMLHTIGGIFHAHSIELVHNDLINEKSLINRTYHII